VFVWDQSILESIFVPSGSMEPTILHGERLLVWKWPSWVFSTSRLNRFDIVVIKRAGLRHRIIKRVIALPGECVVLRDGYRVEIDGKPLSLVAEDSGQGLFKEFDPESLHDHTMQAVRLSRLKFETKFGNEPGYCLDKDEYYVLGDNRWQSKDSRVLGPVRRRDIRGKAWRIYMSVDHKTHRMRWGRVGLLLQ
jgi:signal peptidase I